MDNLEPYLGFHDKKEYGNNIKHFIHHAKVKNL